MRILNCGRTANGAPTITVEFIPAWFGKPRKETYVNTLESPYAHAAPLKWYTQDGEQAEEGLARKMTAAFGVYCRESFLERRCWFPAPQDLPPARDTPYDRWDCLKDEIRREGHTEPVAFELEEVRPAAKRSLRVPDEILDDECRSWAERLEELFPQAHFRQGGDNPGRFFIRPRKEGEFQAFALDFEPDKESLRDVALFVEETLAMAEVAAQARPTEDWNYSRGCSVAENIEEREG